ncbi:hypothetical protein [Riemerella anatipestifer]|uniref:hypothetical protein n=1 Tax=Riemerella anatipestifer TaxID=34085 RepID=UPI00129DABAE|nr:hypothetical protein [Riemerella anatipestifer]MRM84330.1 hypothetical protein [Riemerella anatipestifer]
MKKILLILVLFFSAVSCGTDKEDKASLTNQSIIDLAKTGVSDNLICQFISVRDTQFKVETKDIIYLKQNNVSDKVIVEMKKAQNEEEKQRKYLIALDIVLGLAICLFIVWLVDLVKNRIVFNKK